jgi:hypothetical protein
MGSFLLGFVFVHTYIITEETSLWLTILLHNYTDLIGISGWLSKKKDKLPLVKAYIDSEVESLEEFQIRKIKWGIEELERQRKDITLWSLAETAGVKPRYMEHIIENIENLLLEKGYCVNIYKNLRNAR